VKQWERRTESIETEREREPELESRTQERGTTRQRERLKALGEAEEEGASLVRQLRGGREVAGGVNHFICSTVSS